VLSYFFYVIMPKSDFIFVVIILSLFGAVICSSKQCGTRDNVVALRSTLLLYVVSMILSYGLEILLRIATIERHISRRTFFVALIEHADTNCRPSTPVCLSN
jgi:hypothetical protein